MKKLFINKSNRCTGTGLFTAEPCKKGEVLLLFSLDSFIIPKELYNQQQKNDNKLMTQTGCRLVGDLFLYTDSRVRLENYINHSFTPNVLYHAGICLAKRDLDPNEELLIDYRYILSEEDDAGFVDQDTGLEVKGLDGRTALKQSAAELLELLSDGSVVVR
jgi:hypothetical protein